MHKYIYTSMSTQQFSLPTQLHGQSCLSTLPACLPRWATQPHPPCGICPSTFYPASFLRQSHLVCQAHRHHQSLFSSCCLLNFTVPLQTSTSFIHPSSCTSPTSSQPLPSLLSRPPFHPFVPKPLFPGVTLREAHLYLCIAVLQESKLLVRRQCNCGCFVFILSIKGKRNT